MLTPEDRMFERYHAAGAEALKRARCSPALNYLLGQTEGLGDLTREARSEDQRSKRVKLTPRGQAVIQGIREIVAEVETEWETQLGAGSFAQLRDLLTQLCAITSTPPRQPRVSHQS
jgi:hypothetical protein